MASGQQCVHFFSIIIILRPIPYIMRERIPQSINWLNINQTERRCGHAHFASPPETEVYRFGFFAMLRSHLNQLNWTPEERTVQEMAN